MFDEITFEQFLAEKLSVPNLDDGLNKRRHAMPQLSQFDKFKADLKANDIKMTEGGTKNPKSLTPTQSNFNEEKVEAMIENGTWNNKPIIVSDDDYVIDGHHRWLAAVQTKKPVKVCVVGMTAEKLLDFLKDKDYVIKHTIKE